jgi:regulatory protein
MTARPAGAESWLGAEEANGGAAAPADAHPGAAAPIDERALQKAIDLAYAHVNRRERTVAEVHSQLERKGIAPAHAEAAVQTLLEQHLLDDERFAQLYVTDKRELEQWGAERIRRGLSARGIDRELAEWALVAAAPDPGADARDGELDRALALLRRRFPQPPRERRDRDRALGVLMRKGYEQELAIDALNAHARGD